MTIAMIARYLSTPVPMVEQMDADDVVAYHAAALEIVDMENKAKG